MAPVRFRTVSVNRNRNLCGSVPAVPVLAVPICGSDVSLFIGEASEYLYWFSSSDSVRHYSRFSGARGPISGAYGPKMPNSGRIGALLGGTTGGSRELWGERWVQILPHFGHVWDGSAK